MKTNQNANTTEPQLAANLSQVATETIELAIKYSPEAVFRLALIELFERDIAELKQTKNPGWKSFCRELNGHIRLLRQELKEIQRCE